MEALDYLRLFNAGLSSGVLVWLMLDLRLRSRYIFLHEIYIRIALAGFLFVIAEGSIERIVTNAEFGFHTIFSTAATVWALIGLYLGRKDNRSYQTRVRNNA